MAEFRDRIRWWNAMSDATSIWTVVAVVLLAVVVGATIPVLYQLQQTLRATRRMLGHLEGRVERTMVAVQETSERVNRLGREIEKHDVGLRAVLEGVTGLAEPLKDLQGSIRSAASLGKTLGPALAAAVGAYTAYRVHSGAADPEPEGDAAPDRTPRARPDTRSDQTYQQGGEDEG